jgi:hypothetical protein
MLVNSIFSRNLMFLAKFTFVATRVIQLLDFVVRELTVDIVAPSLTSFAQHVVVLVEVWPSVIDLVMVAETRISIMQNYNRRCVYIIFCTG